MNQQEAKAKLKRITDDALGIDFSWVDHTLYDRVFYIYTEVWEITMEQLDKIRSQVEITCIDVDGRTIKLTAKI